MVTLATAIDARKATQGAAEYKSAVDGMAKSNKSFDKAHKDAEKTVTKFGKTLEHVKSQMKTYLAGFFAIQGAREAIKVIADFDESLAQLGVISQASRNELMRLEATARELGASTRFSASQAVDGLTFLARAGFEVEEQLAAIEPTLNFATAASLELGRAADIASNVLGQFNLAATETSRVTDAMVGAANNANTNVEQLADAMVKAGPIANLLKVDIEQTAAAIGALGDQGIQGGIAGRNLRGVLAALSAPSTDAKKAFEAAGIAIADLDVKTRGLNAVLATLAESGLDSASIFKIFGRENAAAAAVLISSQQRVVDLEEKIRSLTGVSKETADVMGDTLPGQFAAFKSALQEVILQGGDEGLTGVLKGILEALTVFLRVLGGVNPELDKLGFIMQVVAGAGATVKIVYNAVTSALKAAHVAILSVVIGASEWLDLMLRIGATIPEVLQNGGKIWKTWSEVVELAISHPWETAKLVVAETLIFIGQKLTAFVRTFQGLADKLGFGDKLMALQDGIRDNITGAGTALEKESEQLKDQFTEKFAELNALIVKPLEAQGPTVFAQFAERLRADREGAIASITQDILDIGTALGVVPKPQAPGGGAAPTDPLGDGAGIEEVAGPSFGDGEERRLQALRDSLKSELELLAEHHNTKQEFINDLRERELIGEGDHLSLRRDLQAQFEAEHTAIVMEEEERRKRARLAAANDAIAISRQTFATLGAFAEAFGNDQLKNSKAFAIAQAIINTAQGITQALAAYPPPVSFAMAGLVAAAGAAQIATISKQQKGGGGIPTVSGGGGGGRGATTTEATHTNETRRLILDVNGEEIDVDEMFDNASDGSIRRLMVRADRQNGDRARGLGDKRVRVSRQ